MGLYPGNDQWDANIHYVEINDPGQGGYNGISNIARIQLANRTLYLRNRHNEHVTNTSNPHGVTKGQVGLANVLNVAQLARDNNLSDVPDKATGRANLGVYSSVTVDTLLSGKLTKASNLADLPDKSASRINLSVYSRAEMDAALAGKAAVNHTHAADGDFSALKTTNGYQKLPSGIIIQWGALSFPGATGGTVTFPLAFPVACLNVLATAKTVIRPVIASITRLNFVFDCDQYHPQAYWQAIGY